MEIIKTSSIKVQLINYNILKKSLKKGKYLMRRYIYTGELDLTKQLCEDILELLIASDELLLEELVEYLQEYLIQQQKNWVQQNSVFILNKFASYKKLQDYCLESACEDSQPFITSKNSLLLDKDILYSILERNDLQIKEIDAWNYLIKWGIEQTPGLESENNDVSKWTNENYKNLEKTLRQFIPLIRFTEISPIDFFDKVRPYKDIIPNHIYDEVEDFYYKDTQNMKISRVIDSSKAILDYYDNGFNFGQGSLCMKYQNLYVNNRNGIYENNLNTDIVYTIEEIETFNVIRCK
ncbi:hypothetical protein RhiirA4_447662 [Rhizophagus irregularis]|uniref:BACK domain-containing protein n=1 Tax=Rhizophagus irregularis TaxID=588596 RepID=A0A2I1H3Z3_9GLOM|nr:hypothetical protein RhiirA4_447662 [Rhizophagus irregularis]